ncbi:MAG: rhodanese-like domain-containing protein [Phormidesmis sp.]
MLKIFGLFSAPKFLNSAASPSDLKKRLDWGEPALTIIDIRSKAAFLKGHITGAVPISDAILVESVSANLEIERDIYVYSGSDEQSAAAAHRLREAGYQSVAELKGGLSAWQAIKGSVETSW